MNKLNIQNLAALIERQPPASADTEGGFNMAEHYHEDAYMCRTPSCIAGYAAYQAIGSVPFLFSECERVAAEWLDLPKLQADDLFYPPTRTGDYAEIQPAQAAYVLRHLAEYDRVDWELPL